MRRHAKVIGTLSAALLLALALGATLAGAVAPVVSIDPAPTASYTTAHVSGTVDPEDQETFFYFQYSTDPVNEGWSSGAFQGPLAPGAGPTSVSDDLSGLKPDTEYEVRLIAENFSEPAQTISAEPDPTFTTDAVGPAGVSIDPVTTFTGTTAHFSGTIDPEAPAGNPAAFDVNWHFDCSPACPGLAAGTIPADSTGHVVEADATGLEPNTAYEVTLVAENAGGPASDGPEQFTTETSGPLVRALAAGSRSDTMAWLGALVNPRNSPTTYYVEYTLASDTAYASSSIVPASAGADAGSGGALVAVSQLVTGLAPDTAYRFRVVAENDQGEQTIGPDRTFETDDALPVSPLGRGYEMVSPLDKNGGDVDRDYVGAVGPDDIPSVSGAADDGNAVAYVSRTTIGEAEAGSWFPTMRSARTPNGWTTTAITPLQVNPFVSGAVTGRVMYLSENLSRAVVKSNVVLAPEAEDLEPFAMRLYLRSFIDSPAYRLLNDPDSVVSGQTGTDGGDSIRFGAATRDMSHIAFYSTVGLTPGGSAGVYEWVDGDVRLVGDGVVVGGSTNSTNATGDTPGFHPISEDGERIFITTVATQTTGPVNGEIRVREHGTTTRVLGNGHFLGAKAADGAVAYFDFAGGLLRWDADAAPGDELSTIVPPDGGNSLLGSAGMSDDARSLYFGSTRLLAPGGEAGETNLYLWREGEGIRFVAGPVEANAFSEARFGLVYKTARVTTDGDRALFVSSDRLSAQDNGGKRQLYLYDASLNELTCVSCNRDGSPSTADAELFGRTTLKGAPPRLPRNLSADGRRAFFETAEALLPADVNGQLDVYEWSDPDGDLDGDLRLISSGTSPLPSKFIDASESGGDVFFTTQQRLVGFDTDSHVDVYDARVGGGFPEQQVPPECVGSECQGPLDVSPGVDRPGSGRFSGPGSSKPDCARLRERASRKGAAARSAPPKKAARLRAQVRQLKQKARRCESPAGRAESGKGGQK